MAIIKTEDIAAYYVDGKCLCSECASDQDKEAAGMKDILTFEDVENEDDAYFCDECRDRIRRA